MKLEIKINSDLEDNKIVLEAKELYEEVIGIKNIFKEISFKSITAYEDKIINVVKREDIYSFFIENKKVYLRTKNKFYQMHKRLYEIEEIIGTSQFIKISQSEIVNMNKVVSLDTSFKNTLKVNFDNGASTYASRRSIVRIKKYLGLE